MEDRKPERWDEPIVEALWRPDLLFGAPPWFHLHWLIWAALVVWIASFKPLLIGGAVHVALVKATKADPEWPKTVRDFWKTPDDLDV